jgi:predicted nucleic acid-binding Zn ribbon protein
MAGSKRERPLSTRYSVLGTEKGPEALGEILSRLFAARGWGRRQGRLQLEEAWAAAVGPESAPHTRVGAVKRGVLEVLVDNAVLLQELVHYQKRQILERLRSGLPGTSLTDLRFRLGTWQEKS